MSSIAQNSAQIAALIQLASLPEINVSLTYRAGIAIARAARCNRQDAPPCHRNFDSPELRQNGCLAATSKPVAHAAIHSMINSLGKSLQAASSLVRCVSPVKRARDCRRASPYNPR